MRDVHVVSSAVGSVASLVLGAAAGIVCAEVLDDVVLHKRVVGRTIDGETGVARRIKAAAVIDGTVGCV